MRADDGGQSFLQRELPGVKVNSGANFRIVQLVQEGFVQLQP